MTIGRYLAASYAGNAWTAMVQLVFIPAYVALLGVESYGLIGVYGFLQVAISLLDAGITPTMSREVARASAGAGTPDRIRDLLRSLEVLVLLLAVAVAAVSWAVAPLVAESWPRATHLPPSTVANALGLIGSLIAVRLSMGVHRGAIAGSQDYVWLNGALATFATLRGAGVVPVLWWSPTIEAFFGQQLAVTVVEAAFMRSRAWRRLPGSRAPRFSPAGLRAVRGFAAGVAALGGIGLVLAQADKAIVSALLPLREFGYYAIAVSAASALALVHGPVAAVAYPRLNGIAVAGDSRSFLEAFHEFCQLGSIVVAPAALVLALLPGEVLTLWTGDPALSSAVAPLLGPLALGAMLNCSVQLPCLLPLVRGRPVPPAMIQLVVATVFVPAVYLGVSVFGALAAAWAWFALNAVAMALAFAIPQQDFSRHERMRWLVFDIGSPSVAGLAAVGLVAALGPVGGPSTRLAAAVPVALAGASSLLAAAFATRAGRIRLQALADRLTSSEK